MPALILWESIDTWFHNNNCNSSRYDERYDRVVVLSLSYKNPRAIHAAIKLMPPGEVSKQVGNQYTNKWVYILMSLIIMMSIYIYYLYYLC